MVHSVNSWLTRHAVLASRMGGMELRDFPFKFVSVDWIENHIVEEVCDNCTGCVATSPLDRFCKHYSTVAQFVQLAVAADLSLSNYPFYKAFTGGVSDE